MQFDTRNQFLQSEPNNSYCSREENKKRKTEKRKNNKKKKRKNEKPRKTRKTKKENEKPRKTKKKTKTKKRKMQFYTRNQFLQSELKYLLLFPRGKQKTEKRKTEKRKTTKNGKTKKK